MGSHGHRGESVFYDDLCPSLIAWPGPEWVTRLVPAGPYNGCSQQSREGCFHAQRIVAVPEQDIGKILQKTKENLHLGLLVM